jgi:DNA-binding NarL/FixJ family response regulator
MVHNFVVINIMTEMRVLLADDSGLILERLTEMLRMYKKVEIVGTLKNGSDALNSLRTLNPDLAIVDLKMPGLSGLEVLHEIRKENKTVKIIILTFYSTDYYRNIAIQAGADYFFNKVDDFDEVSMVVAGMLWKEFNGKMIKS